MDDITNYRLLRYLRRTLYTLKRSYGGTISIYTLVDASVSYTTGVRTSIQTTITIPRAIVLPLKVQRELITIGALTSDNKAVSYGGAYDVGTRLFVIDIRDVPDTFKIQLDDWIVYKNKRFNLKSIEKLEENAGWSIVGCAVEAPDLLAHQDVWHELALLSLAEVS